MIGEAKRERAASFGAVADAYERSRPGYPDEAVRWLVGEEPCDVLDLGAGTGKLTRSLVALGHRVTAVEPLAEMREELHHAVPGAACRAGTAESIPLPDATVDVVTVAQAFHWFDQGPALREIARVLRPGGRLALVWNTRDTRVPWVAELSAVMVGRTGVDRELRALLAAGGVAAADEVVEKSMVFGPLEQVSFDHTQPIDRETLRELVTSRSYCAVLSDEERAPILAGIDALFERHAVDGVLTLPYRTECFRTQVYRPGGA